MPPFWQRSTHPFQRGAARRAWRWLGTAALFLLQACALVPPQPESIALAERLERLPRAAAGLARPVTIHWDAHQVPFVEAETDDDLAYALGLVHAHLRLAQMELLRRIARGRLSESVGPFGVELDHALRLLDFGRAAGAVVAAMPPETRRFVDAYVAGINLYLREVRTLPLEFATLGLVREPWTDEDVVTVGRLVSADVNWIVWFGLMAQRTRPGWPDLWRSLIDDASGTISPHAAGNPATAGLVALLLAAARTGSNAFAVAARRTAAGGAIVAGDPHLGLFLPNAWLIAGMRSPSYHAVGLMVPGLPFVALGRNPWIAWGGTNLHAAASELVDVSHLPDSDFTRRRERIRVRLWFDREVELRESPFGPVISDSALIASRPGETLALRWLGHDASDEITAMLSVNRARDFASFRRALAGFAVPGQSMLYGDVDGHVGRVTAARLPRREPAPPRDLAAKPDDMRAWRTLASSDDLPWSFDPPEGFVASANDRPAGSAVPIGWLFSPTDRIRRLTAILGADRRFDGDDAGRVLLDTRLESAASFRDRMVRWIGEAVAPETAALVDALKGWDGDYGARSRGAAAYELVLSHLAHALFDADALAALAAGWRGRERLQAAIAAADDAQRDAALRSALIQAAEDFGQARDWGDLHRLVLRHPLALVPLISGFYRFADEAASGTSDTLNKTAHALVDGRHAATYGSTARYVCDLSDPDRNRFVLLGGQDGFLGSANFLDQLALWRDGRMIEVPLRLDSVRARFPYRTRIEPTHRTPP